MTDLKVELPEDKLARARARVAELSGLSDEGATELVTAALEGAVDHALEMIVGTASVPSNLGATRADHLQYKCARLGRLPKQREVELIFRITGATAKSVWGYHGRNV